MTPFHAKGPGATSVVGAKYLGVALHLLRYPVQAPVPGGRIVAEQDRGLGLLRALRRDADRAWHGYVERSIKGWTRHRDIVARFGRFPHRNAVLGRDSTTEEQAYMAASGKSFGQESASSAIRLLSTFSKR